MTFLLRFSTIAASTMALAAATLLANAAHATLGAGYASVEADRLHMGARHAMVAQAGYTVHTLTPAGGGLLREFTRPDGQVFAIAWQGPGRPDLRQALGAHFEELNAANPPRVRGGRHIPLAADEADLVVRSGGHSGAFWGVAYVPGMIPPGVSPADIR